MVVVSSREFRANQKKYFELAHSNDVVIKSREHGSYRLVPIASDDAIIDATLKAKILRGLEEFHHEKAIVKPDGESVEEFINRLIND